MFGILCSVYYSTLSKESLMNGSKKPPNFFLFHCFCCNTYFSNHSLHFPFLCRLYHFLQSSCSSMIFLVLPTTLQQQNKAQSSKGTQRLLIRDPVSVVWNKRWSDIQLFHIENTHWWLQVCMCLNQKGLLAHLLKLQLSRWPRGEPEKKKATELTKHKISKEIKSAATATVLQFLKPAQTSGQK